METCAKCGAEIQGNAWGVASERMGDYRLFCRPCYLIWKAAQRKDATLIFQYPPKRSTNDRSRP